MLLLIASQFFGSWSREAQHPFKPFLKAPTNSSLHLQQTLFITSEGASGALASSVFNLRFSSEFASFISPLCQATDSPDHLNRRIRAYCTGCGCLCAVGVAVWFFSSFFENSRVMKASLVADDCLSGAVAAVCSIHQAPRHMIELVACFAISLSKQLGALNESLQQISRLRLLMVFGLGQKAYKCDLAKDVGEASKQRLVAGRFALRAACSAYIKRSPQIGSQHIKL